MIRRLWFEYGDNKFLWKFIGDEITPMTTDRLRRIINARPFRSFRILMTNGSEHVVRHPEMIMLRPREMAYFYHDDGAVSVLDLLLIPEVKIDPIPARPPRH